MADGGPIRVQLEVVTLWPVPEDVEPSPVAQRYAHGMVNTIYALQEGSARQLVHSLDHLSDGDLAALQVMFSTATEIVSTMREARATRGRPRA